MNNDAKPIGVFDSGIGGLSALRHMIDAMPDRPFVYLGDSARVPYGNKSADTVTMYARQCAAFLMGHDVSMIVVACNTASAVALDVLQREVTVPVVGVIDPAAKYAVEVTRNGRIGVIGTRATIASNAYGLAISKLVGTRPIEIVSSPCPLFVPLVEEGWLDHPATFLIAQDYLRPMFEGKVDTLVLGCTHYPLLKPLLERLMPDVVLVDSGECAARTACSLVGAATVASTVAPQISMYLTDGAPQFQPMAEVFLGRPIEAPMIVSLDSYSATTPQR
jgi:glutamate racemase